MLIVPGNFATITMIEDNEVHGLRWGCFGSDTMIKSTKATLLDFLASFPEFEQNPASTHNKLLEAANAKIDAIDAD